MNFQFFKEQKDLVSTVLSIGKGDDLKMIQAAIFEFNLIKVFFSRYCDLKEDVSDDPKVQSSVSNV